MFNALALLSSAALLAAPGTGTKPEKPQAKDANRTICKMVELTGSRFNKERVCMTAAEWENARQADRQAVERIQMGSCVRGAGC